jgi:uncharacterized protein (DUF305 family)
MKKESYVVGGACLIVGLLVAGIAAGYAVNHNYGAMMSAIGIHSDIRSSIATSMHSDAINSGNSMSMEDMMSGLSGQTGDNFDNVFLAEMIDHHQGAIDMARSAQQNAKHDEIKSLAAQIVTAQTAEISQMKVWQAKWGYIPSSTSSDNTMNMMH